MQILQRQEQDKPIKEVVFAKQDLVSKKQLTSFLLDQKIEFVPDQHKVGNYQALIKIQHLPHQSSSPITRSPNNSKYNTLKQINKVGENESTAKKKQSPQTKQKKPKQNRYEDSNQIRTTSKKRKKSPIANKSTQTDSVNDQSFLSKSSKGSKQGKRQAPNERYEKNYYRNQRPTTPNSKPNGYQQDEFIKRSRTPTNIQEFNKDKNRSKQQQESGKQSTGQSRRQSFRSTVKERVINQFKDIMKQSRSISKNQEALASKQSKDSGSHHNSPEYFDTFRPNSIQHESIPSPRFQKAQSIQQLNQVFKRIINQQFEKNNSTWFRQLQINKKYQITKKVFEEQYQQILSQILQDRVELMSSDQLMMYYSFIVQKARQLYVSFLKERGIRLVSS